LREAVLAAPLEAATPRSVVDPAALARLLHETREAGFAISIGERVPATNSIAVPLLARDGYAIGSLAILWPSRGGDVDDERRREWPALLLDAVRDVQGTF
jgi:DNA-binding IclR family transcriptional regulator